MKVNTIYSICVTLCVIKPYHFLNWEHENNSLKNYYFDNPRATFLLFVLELY